MESIEFLGHVFSKYGSILTEQRVQGIVDLPEPTSVKAVRSFIGMVNYFRDYISDLSGLLVPLTELTKKKWTDEPFSMTSAASRAFKHIKLVLLGHSHKVIMNEVDPLILYTDASTTSVAGVLMQVQGGVEMPCQFVSHTLSDQATRWGIMELELYAFVFCVKQLAPYLLGRRFIVRTDHRNLLYLSNSTVPKLVRWRVLLSEYQYTVEHISGKENVVADGLTRVHRSQLQYIKPNKRHLYHDDTIPRVFRLVGEDMEGSEEGYVEDSDEDNEHLEALGPIERRNIFSRFHNSMVGHFGIDRTLKALAKAGHGWRGMRADVTGWINECGICQKIKHQRHSGWEDEYEHHLYSTEPLKNVSVDTAGPFPEDEHGNQHIILIVDDFSKFVGLYPSRSTTSEEYAQALIQWVAIFGVPYQVRSDGATQFNSKLSTDLKSLLNYQHLTVVAYHPQANGLAERRMAEVKKHLLALVYEKRIKERWSRYLPLVQRILNYTVDGSIGTQPARVILGDLADTDLVMDLPEAWANRNVAEYLTHLRAAQATLIRATQDYLNSNQKKRGRDGGAKSTEVAQFHEGQYVLLEYPTRPPNKLSGLYRGPMVIHAIERPDLITLRDLTNNKLSLVHTSRIKAFRHPAEMTEEEATALAAVDMDEFYVDSIIDHTWEGKNPKKWKYRVRWLGYEPEDDTWLPWSSIKDLEALDKFIEDGHPECSVD
jgi:cleavage and polyadenylation specificity factor subunit 1